MRISTRFLKELIEHQGRLKDGPIGQMGVLRMALDLREAQEKIAQLESTIALREATQKPQSAQQQRRLHVAEEMATGNKVDHRA